MAFRLFSLTWGRFQAIADRIKRILVEALVRRRRTVPLALRRTIALRATSLSWRIRSTAPSGLAVETVAAGDKFATIHMGSSRYFQEQELATAEPGVSTAPPRALRPGSRYTRSQIWSFD